MDSGGDRRARARADVGRGAGDRAGGGDAAEERRDEVADAEREQLGVGIVPRAGHAVGDHRRRAATRWRRAWRWRRPPGAAREGCRSRGRAARRRARPPPRASSGSGGRWAGISAEAARPMVATSKPGQACGRAPRRRRRPAAARPAAPGTRLEVSARPEQQQRQRGHARPRSSGGSKRWARARTSAADPVEEVVAGVRATRRPRKSLSCRVAITTAMPAVKPVVTGWGMNWMSRPEPDQRPCASRMTPAMHRRRGAARRGRAVPTIGARMTTNAAVGPVTWVASRRAARTPRRRRWPCRGRAAAATPEAMASAIDSGSATTPPPGRPAHRGPARDPRTRQRACGGGRGPGAAPSGRAAPAPNGTASPPRGPAPHLPRQSSAVALLRWIWAGLTETVAVASMPSAPGIRLRARSVAVPGPRWPPADRGLRVRSRPTARLGASLDQRRPPTPAAMPPSVRVIEAEAWDDRRRRRASPGRRRPGRATVAGADRERWCFRRRPRAGR